MIGEHAEHTAIFVFFFFFIMQTGTVDSAEVNQVNLLSFLSFLVRECQLEGWKVSVEGLNHGTENSLVHRNPGKRYYYHIISIQEKGMAVMLFPN